MTEFQGNPLEMLGQDGELALYRGIDGDGAPILVLAPLQEHPAQATLGRLENEYALRGELDPAWAACPCALVREAGKLLLLLDDPGGELLEGRLRPALGLEFALPLAISLTQALGQAHARGLIHKDLTPGHILIQERQVRLTGFGLASRLPKESQAPVPPEIIAGTLPYLAPEQTGRMNRSIDARSDLYAFGVVLYRMLTGELPFSASDPMEWVHCHIARQPVPPAERVPGLPAAVSAIVMKCLAKTAEERYQTAAGVAKDLMRCQEEWAAGGNIRPFPLGQRDLSDQLRIPEKLYGREAQVRDLEAAFGRVVATGRPELVLVSGYSGIGKSSVVNELQRAMVPPRGLFAAGKFEQYQRDVPYGPLAQALSTLVRQLLCQGEAELDTWREALRTALGSNGQLVVDLVPELERVVGSQAPIAEMPPQEAENRFTRVLGRFLGVLARPEHPLVLFLDDLQWLDPATLKFLKYLVTHPDTRHLLAIGAFRDNEVGPAHPLRLTLDAIRQTPTAIREIVLTPLGLDHIGQLLADSLHCTPDQTLSLAQLVLEKTGGNPFFVIQFVTNLRDEGLLAFDPPEAAWKWDLEQIRAKGYTDNVVDLMLGKLQQLPPATQTVLGWLACLGKEAEAGFLALAQGTSPSQTAADLWPAVRAGFVLSLGVGDGYRCSHDRVQEAAYALIPERQRAARHLDIGRRLLAHLTPNDLAARLFDVVGQVNLGETLITDPKERENLGRLNAQAGRRAKAAIACAAASGYLARAMALLPADAWDADYEETFSLYLDRAECEYLAGNFEAADQLFDQVLTRISRHLDRARVCRLRSRLYMMSGRFADALDLIVDALKLLGVELPDSDMAQLAAANEEMDRLRAQVTGPAIARLADLPQATDPMGEMLIGLLVDGLIPAYSSRPPIFPLLAVKAVDFSLRYGNSVDSCMAYYSYSIVLIAFRWDLPAAFEFSHLALTLAGQFADPRHRGGTLAGYGGLVLPWRRHIAEGIPYLEQGLAALLEVGDFPLASNCAMLPAWAVLEQGESLDRLVEVSDKYAALSRQLHNALVEETVLVCQRLVASLKGETSPPESFDGGDFKLDDCLERFRAAGWHTGVAYCRVMEQIAAYLYGRYPEALAAADEAAPVLSLMMAMQVSASSYYYRLLTLAALYPQATGEEQRTWKEQLAEGLARLKFWAENCPANFANRHALLAAEVARLEGRIVDAEQRYEEAIRSARDNGFAHHEALANELAARFYLARGIETCGLAYLRNARYAYLRWGALGKVRALESAWPQLTEPDRAGPAAIGTPLEQLDVATVVKASQAVSSDIVLDRLTETLMRIALEHAGADRGLLLVPQAESYRIAARASMERGELQVTLGVGPPGPADLPAALLHYVARSHEAVLLDDSSAPNLFSEDPYLAGQAAGSILCLPLVKQAKLVGILYLENRLTPRAFTRKHLAVLELLASQAAISLENASLYAGLQEREARIRRLVDANIIGIIFGNLAGDVISANDALLDMVGYSRQDLESGNMRWPEMTPAEYRSADLRTLAELRATGRCRPYEKEFVRKDGSRVPVLIGATLFEGSRDEGVAFVLDLTERKRAEAESLAREAAEAANRAKSRFLANMSHELRSPLNTILGFTRLLARDPAQPETAREDLGLVLKSGEHLLGLINEVLDISKLEAGRTSLNEADFDLDFLLDELRDLLIPSAVAKGLQLVFAPRPGVPRHIRSDPLKLRQILINLIGNAIKFTCQGSVTVTVEAQKPAAGSDRSRLLFAVADTGPGIAADEQGSLFEPFAQTRGGREAREGTGLGLAISRGFVHLMGGELGIASEEGHGTTVSFDLPVQTVENLPIREEALPRQVIGLAPGQPRHRLLVVDDHAEARLLLVRLLAPLGFDVDEAANGLEAIELWRQGWPELIWMDLRMPMLDGREATRRIRAEQTAKRPVIIALTASSFEEERQDVLASGFDDMLRKPFRETEIFALLERHLGAKFIYQETALGPTPPPASAPVILPDPLRVRLEEAVAQLDPEGVEQAIAAIRNIDAQFAQTLAASAREFQYDAILALVKKADHERK